jgi:hypothetical protein
LNFVSANIATEKVNIQIKNTKIYNRYHFHKKWIDYFFNPQKPTKYSVKNELLMMALEIIMIVIGLNLKL